MAQPLAGIRVIDLGMYVAGPYVSVILGDLGADVLKIEPLGGEPGRVYFRGLAACNRGKRAIAVDMKTVEGAEVVRRICQTADVVHHNFRPGVSGRLGVDAPTLRGRKAELIVLETPGYGTSGPKSDWPGFDMIFQAYCGHEHHAAGEGNPPLWYRFAIVDFAAGMLGAVAVLGALYRRRRGGEGASLSVSLFDTGIYLLSELLGHDGSVTGIKRLNPAQTGFHPAESLYQTEDGWIAVAARDDAMAAELARVLGCTEVASHPRGSWGEAERSAISKALREVSTDEAEYMLREAGVWVQRCRTDAARELLSSSALRASGTTLAGTHPKYGDTLQIGPCVSLSAAPIESAARRGGIPALGEHTREVLREIGYAAADIDTLYARKVVA